MSNQTAPIYEVTFFVDRDISGECDSWLAEHIRDALRVEGVVDCNSYVQADDAEGRARRVVLYVLEDDEALRRWITIGLDACRKLDTGSGIADCVEEIIRLAVMLYVRFPLSLRNVEDLLHERGIDVSHETIRFWWQRFGPIFAAEIRYRRAESLRAVSPWRWHLDEMFVKTNGERHYLWRAVDHEGEVLERFVTKTREKKAALKFLKKAMKKHGRVV